MTVIELRFPAGRLHATPWGRHVNEGAVEWPPSPWRLVRALLATWHLKVKAEVTEQTMRELLQALASKPPAFQLPTASLGHTRHYLPIIEGKNQKTTKVFDTFIHLGGPLRVGWEVQLSPEHTRTLGLLCQRLGYFGRAESLVEAEVLPPDPVFEADSRPLPPEEPVPVDSELVRLLAPVTPEAYQAWVSAGTPAPTIVPAKPKRGKAGKDSSSEPPVDLFAAMHADTGDLQVAGWSLPPGSQLVDYIRREDCFTVAPVASHLGRARPTVARFALASAVLPRLTRAVSVAERVHQALLSRFAEGTAPEVLTGRDAQGHPLPGHRHAFVFCETTGPRDSISHLTLFARGGFDASARRALESLQRVWGHGGHDLQLILLGMGDADSFTDTTLFGPARMWRSLTPFVSTRHPKTYRDGRPKLDSDGWIIGSPEHDLRRLILETGLPAPSKVIPVPEISVNGRRLRPLEFQSERHHGGGTRAHQPPKAFEVSFPEPVRGPLAFGYGAHFGLGLFLPVLGAERGKADVV
jgi:CRISPR-associated protein Csb2